jgi:ABC-type transport system involved in cytochrome bd biosynthesis fused ATPase/permease subunit
MTNLHIANIFLFFAILCMALRSSAGLLLYCGYSLGATAMAGAVRYQQLDHKPPKARRPH